MLVWDKAKGFVTKAFTVIFLACVVVWFLQTFDARLNVVDDRRRTACSRGSAALIAPVFAPLGFGDWRAATALMHGLHGEGERRVHADAGSLGGDVSGADQAVHAGDGHVRSWCSRCCTRRAWLPSPPCAARLARRPRGAARWCFVQCGIAWVVSFAVYFAGSLVTGGIAYAFSLPGLVAALVIALGIGVYLKHQRTDGELKVGCKTCPANCKNSSGCCH